MDISAINLWVERIVIATSTDKELYKEKPHVIATKFKCVYSSLSNKAQSGESSIQVLRNEGRKFSPEEIIHPFDFVKADSSCIESNFKNFIMSRINSVKSGNGLVNDYFEWRYFIVSFFYLHLNGLRDNLLVIYHIFSTIDFIEKISYCVINTVEISV